MKVKFRKRGYLTSKKEQVVWSHCEQLPVIGHKVVIDDELYKVDDIYWILGSDPHVGVELSKIVEEEDE
jgi:hypothetical protein